MTEIKGCDHIRDYKLLSIVVRMDSLITGNNIRFG